jgi:hypothetical protein
MVNELDQPVAFVREILTNFAQRAVELQRTGRFGARNITEMAEGLEPECARAFSPHHPELVGVGIVWEGGSSDGDESGMLWWRADTGVIARKVHVHNPDSDSYYDYRSSEWYQAARDGSGLTIAGPFIDAWGTDEHAITPSLAILDDGKFVGVAAADLDVPFVTSWLARILRRHGDLVLVNSEDRVVASNHPLLTPGLRLDPFLSRAEFTVVDRVPATVSGWQILDLRRIDGSR